MAELRETVTRRRKWGAWYGSAADFRQIMRAFESQMDDIREVHVAQKSQYELNRLAGSEKSLQDLLTSPVDEDPYLTGRFQRLRDAAESDLENARNSVDKARRVAEAELLLELTINEGKDDTEEIQGTAEAIAEYLSDRTSSVTSLSLTAPAGYVTAYKIVLTAGPGSGLSLQIRSQDRKWAISAVAHISEAITRRVPRWRFLRSLWFIVPFLAVSLFVLLGIIASAIVDGAGKPVGLDIILATIVTFVTWGIVYTTSFGFLERWIPAFELSPPGIKSRAGRLGTFIGATLLAVAIGVFVNLIS